MATFALNGGITAVTPFSKLFAPIRSVSAAPGVRRWLHTDFSHAFSCDDLNRSIDADRRSNSTPFSRRFAPIISVSAVPCVPRWFSTNSSNAYSYDDDFNGSVIADCRPDSTVSRRRDNDFFSISDLFDPISPTRSLSQILNMMDQFTDNPSTSVSRGVGVVPRRSWEANENEEILSLRSDMPGLDKDNIKITVEQNTLIIKAEAEKESEDDDDEKPPRRYSSRIYLPTNGYKVEEIKAELKNGVLKITVPKVKMEERKDVRQIQVE